MAKVLTILRDPILWLVAALSLSAVFGAALIGPGGSFGPDAAGKGAPSGVVAVAPSRTGDKAIDAVANGTFPQVRPGVTLGQAIAGYRWFKDKPKWISRGQGVSPTVLLSVAMELPGEAANLGAGSDAAQVFYAAEFGFTGDGKSFVPLYSAVEVRDAANRLVSRVPDPEFLLLRRIMTGSDPGASLKHGVKRGK